MPLVPPNKIMVRTFFFILQLLKHHTTGFVLFISFISNNMGLLLGKKKTGKTGGEKITEGN